MLQNLNLIEIFYVIVSLLIGMSAHEAMHAYVGYGLGDTTAKDEGRITLNPFKHVDILTTILLPLLLIVLGFPPIFAAKPVPFNPARVKYEEFGAAMIAAAGPLTNLVLAIVAGFIVRLGIVGQGSDLLTFIYIFAQVNIGFFVFNMIPFPPLDGSRVLYAVAPESVQQVMEKIESFGLQSILIFMVLLLPFLSPIIGNISGELFRLLVI